MIHTLRTIHFLLFVYMFAPFMTFAEEEYVPLTKGGIPGVSDIGAMSMTELLNSFFTISVSIAAVLAVIMIAIGGFKYMTSESMFKTSGAKEQIMDAIIGLIIVLSAVLILSVINPDIVSLRIFEV